MILVNISIFYKYFGSLELICGFLEPWETDKLTKKCQKLKEEFMEIILDILNNALSSKMDAIFPIKSGWLLGTKSHPPS